MRLKRILSLVVLVAASACGTSAPLPFADEDAGGPVADAGAPTADSGTTEGDAGVEVDAGLPPEADAGVSPDAGAPDAGFTLDAGGGDAGSPDAGLPDAGTTPSDAGLDPNHPGWARYTIPAGSHAAVVSQNGAPNSPLAGITGVASRTYRFIFNPSAAYTITNPAQPGDQLDWNKLPGLSDCNQFDLSKDGLMFAWRWRLDTTPNVLELAHYANNNNRHLYPAQGIVTLDAADLAAETPLLYELSIGGASNEKYLFRISGTIRGRTIDVQAEHPRRCSSTPPTTMGLSFNVKWAGGFYFGGTSTAPTTITGFIREP